MAPVRKILIADPDLESVRSLSRALRTKGYQVHYAPDGSRALEVAVLRHPDLTLFDEACRLLDARTFIQILRTNPRTEDIPVVLTTASFESDRLRGLRDGYLRKPFNLDEVLSRIEHIFRRSEAAKDLKSEQQEIEGSLSQLSIPDLMQLLGMNRRSGRLTLERGNDRGEISVVEGRPVNAKLGRVEGEKALFRLLAWVDGTFTFSPGGNAARPRINRGMDDALLEGMRQSDEVNRLMPGLPPRHTRLMLAPDADLQGDQHPVTQQVVDLLRQPRALGEVLDRRRPPTWRCSTSSPRSCSGAWRGPRTGPAWKRHPASCWARRRCTRCAAGFSARERPRRWPPRRSSCAAVARAPPGGSSRACPEWRRCPPSPPR
ncbi:DUF4388 domain-containing protein [Myxococcus sp. MxC21-1]|nr:DUF4388 domain-containing protein [Myxococcus sp. MxC21-1]WNZ59748.1 DUF4388 domain-containing protein [Myxococcus sp. MxC21-1]